MSDPATKDEAANVWKAFNDASKALDQLCRREGVTVRISARTFGAVKKAPRRAPTSTGHQP